LFVPSEIFMYRDPVPSLESLSRLPAATRPLRVGMIGIGTVGSGTFRVLARNQAEIAGRAGRGIEVVVVAARNLGRAAAILDGKAALTADPLQVATHPEVDVVVEVAGGTGPARDWVLAAIAHGSRPTRRCWRCTAARSSPPPGSAASAWPMKRRWP
jgi:homoserine dehydrogenase